MNITSPGKRDLYYTTDHEWIDFQGSVAYAGICTFKLTGFKAIHDLQLAASGVFLDRGEKIATVRYNDYEVDVHMPVAGKVIQFNEALEQDQQIVLNAAESSGWIAMISPAQPYDRTSLLLPAAYRLNGKGKYAK